MTLTQTLMKLGSRLKTIFALIDLADVQVINLILLKYECNEN